MKHYVLGLIFNSIADSILLVEKEKPSWMAGSWNGIGGKIEDEELPADAMNREAHEEIHKKYLFKHVITFVCPGGTVYVYLTRSVFEQISFSQMESERLRVWKLTKLPVKLMSNLRWIIPLALSSVQFPIILQQNKLGVNNGQNT